MSPDNQEPAAPSSEDEEQEREGDWKAIVTKFEDAANVGDQFFLYQSWSAWGLNPTEKTIAPIARVVLGDASGNVVFDRSLVLTAVADLINELANTAYLEVVRARSLEGYTLSLPSEADWMLDNFREARERLSKVLDVLEKSALGLHPVWLTPA